MQAIRQFLAFVGCVLPLLANSTASAGDNYAILVGVADYDEKELRPLKFTRADVLDFHTALLDSGFTSKNIVLMHDDFAKLVAHYEKLGSDFKPKDYIPTGANVRKEIELLLGRLQSDDSVIVALAGHGVQFKGDKKSYFCPSDAALNRKDSLIAFEDVFSALKESPAGRKLFLVDACQNDPQSDISRSRASVDLDSVTRPQSESVPEGIIAPFSCKAGQKAFEHPPLGHGVFFYHLLEGWNGKADANEDGQLSYQELAVYTERKTAEYAALKLKVLQTPVLRNEFSGGEWVLRMTLPPIFDAANGRTAAEAKASQEAWARHLKIPVEAENSIGMKLRLIPRGQYMRGSSLDEFLAVQEDIADLQTVDTSDERPQHKVRITKPFYLGTTEVTRGQFRRFVNATGHVTLAEKQGGWGYNAVEGKLEGEFTKYNWKNTGFTQTDDYPVVNMAWNDAKAFVDWLSKEEGKRYRLPTEAEWEYACRSGTMGMFSAGNRLASLEAIANVADESTTRVKGLKLSPVAEWNDRYPFAAPVGSFRANGFGLYDMHGNVWEWCSDWYDANAYKNHEGRAAVDPQGPQSGSKRVMRGNAWSSGPKGARSAVRGCNSPDIRTFLFGFRVALVP